MALPQSPQYTGKTEVVFDQLLGSIPIPANIDPVLLDAWVEKEKREIYAEEDKQKRPNKNIRSLGKVFAVYVGVLAMILSILLGLMQGLAAQDILDTACRILIFFGILGFFSGLVAEYIVRESVVTVVREVVDRSVIPSVEVAPNGPQESSPVQQ